MHEVMAPDAPRVVCSAGVLKVKRWPHIGDITVLLRHDFLSKRTREPEEVKAYCILYSVFSIVSTKD